MRLEAVAAATTGSTVATKEEIPAGFFIIPLREKGLLAYTIPDSPNHPEQAYQVARN